MKPTINTLADVTDVTESMSGNHVFAFSNNWVAKAVVKDQLLYVLAYNQDMADHDLDTHWYISVYHATSRYLEDGLPRGENPMGYGLDLYGSDEIDEAAAEAIVDGTRELVGAISTQ